MQLSHTKRPTEHCLSGKIARTFLGICESAVRDLAQHVGCNIQHASMLFSKIVSLIRVFLLCRAGNRHYYIVVGCAIHEHITAWSTSYMCTNITVNVSKNVICLSKSKEPLLLLEMYACCLASDTTWYANALVEPARAYNYIVVICNARF